MKVGQKLYYANYSTSPDAPLEDLFLFPLTIFARCFAFAYQAQQLLCYLLSKHPSPNTAPSVEGSAIAAYSQRSKSK